MGRSGKEVGLLTGRPAVKQTPSAEPHRLNLGRKESEHPSAQGISTCAIAFLFLID